MASHVHKTDCFGMASVAIGLLFLAVLSWRVTYAVVMTPAEQQEIVDIHNSLRRGEGSSNMRIMTWNPTLAIIAQNWSDNCQWKHGQAINSSSLNDLKMGQNLFTSYPPPINLTYAVKSWFAEKLDYTYTNTGNTCAAGKVCGHYTQVVWANSYEVGCGYTTCTKFLNNNDASFLTCNYSPAGNYIGQLPYQKGPACSQCTSGAPYCNNGLCDRASPAITTAATNNPPSVPVSLPVTTGLPPLGNVTGTMSPVSKAAITSPAIVTAATNNPPSVPVSLPVTTGLPPLGNVTGTMSPVSKAAITSPAIVTAATNSPPSVQVSLPVTTGLPPLGNVTGTMSPVSKAAITSSAIGTAATNSPPSVQVSLPVTTGLPPLGNVTGTMSPVSKAAITSSAIGTAATNSPPSVPVSLPVTTGLPPLGNVTATMSPVSKAAITSSAIGTAATNSPPSVQVSSPVTTGLPPLGNVTGTMSPVSEAAITSSAIGTAATNNPPSVPVSLPVTTGLPPLGNVTATMSPGSKEAITSPAIGTAATKNPPSVPFTSASAGRTFSNNITATLPTASKASNTFSPTTKAISGARTDEIVATTGTPSVITSTTGSIPPHQAPPTSTCLFAVVPNLKLYETANSTTIVQQFNIGDTFQFSGIDRWKNKNDWKLLVVALPDYSIGWVDAKQVAFEDTATVSCG